MWEARAPRAGAREHGRARAREAEPNHHVRARQRRARKDLRGQQPPPPKREGGSLLVRGARDAHSPTTHDRRRAHQAVAPDQGDSVPLEREAERLGPRLLPRETRGAHQRHVPHEPGAVARALQHRQLHPSR